MSSAPGGSPQNIRVVLAEDHKIVRQGLAALLGSEPDIEVVGEASDGREAVQVCARLAPDVIVMDVGMPGLNGVDATRLVRKESPSTRVVILSMYACEEYVRPAIRAGASGYLLKGAGLNDLVAAIRAVASGEAFFSPAVAKILIREAIAHGATGASPNSGADLSGREREVLQLVGEGKTSPEIAKLLHLSVKTIEGHRSRIMAKLDVHELAGLVRCAVRLGLVSTDT
jgi:two-component system, NarL family, response regulator NreC